MIATIPRHCFTTKTCLYNFDPPKPHLHIVKLGFTGVYIIFLNFAQKHRLWYSLEPPRRGGSNEYTQCMSWAEMWKTSEFFIWIFSVFGGEIFYMFELAFSYCHHNHFIWFTCCFFFYFCDVSLVALGSLNATLGPIWTRGSFYFWPF